MSKSWKQPLAGTPRFLQTAIRRGLKMADSINIEEANDKSWVRITFKKFPVQPVPASRPERRR